jgi:hypothetical protein
MFSNVYSRTNGVFSDNVAVGLLTGTGTTTLSISAYTCINQGFYYEGSDITISTVGIALGTYYVVNRVNNTGAAVSVTRCEGTGATTTTIAPRTVRTAIVTTANYSSSTDIIIGQIFINTSAVLQTIEYFNRAWATAATLPTAEYAIVTGSLSASVPNATEVIALCNGTITNSLQGTVIAAATGNYTVTKAGLYLFTAKMAWDTNAVGSRFMRFSHSSGANIIAGGGTAASMVNPGTYLGQPANTVFQTYTWQGLMSAQQTYNLFLYQNSGSARTCSLLDTTLTMLSV